jgi:hypothetical protein
VFDALILRGWDEPDEPFVGGEGKGNRVWVPPLNVPPLNGEASRAGGVKVFERGEAPTLGVEDVLGFLVFFGDALSGEEDSRIGESWGDRRALISIFSVTTNKLAIVKFSS